MPLATVFSRAQNGLNADLVTVEIHLGAGLPGVTVVGLPAKAVREAKDRVKAAIVNSGYKFPGSRRLIINLAPAELPKEGGRFDLAIALGVLAASKQLPQSALRGIEVLGELSLTGDVRPIAGALPAALKACAARRALLVPQANAGEAALARDARVLTARNLGELCVELSQDAVTKAEGAPVTVTDDLQPDLSDVRGQPQARRALEVAAAGGHSILMVGPPGSGKSMLAQRLPGILPPLSEAESIEVAAIASIGPGFDARRWGLRPFRAPHHTASGIALVGGGGTVRPGEITLAHLGVLFLDELPEFSRHVLEVLRQPLETGAITLSRAARQADFPARFQLVAAMNPCPCGYLGDADGRCRCTPDQVQRYRAKLSGPLLDRIDLQIFVPHLQREVLAAPGTAAAESSAAVRARVIAAHGRALARQGKANSRLGPRELETHAALDATARRLLEAALTRLRLSARALHRSLRVARTAADLEGAARVESRHVAEALRYRELDRS